MYMKYDQNPGIEKTTIITLLIILKYKNYMYRTSKLSILGPFNAHSHSS